MILLTQNIVTFVSLLYLIFKRIAYLYNKKNLPNSKSISNGALKVLVKQPLKAIIIGSNNY